MESAAHVAQSEPGALADRELAEGEVGGRECVGLRRGKAANLARRGHVTDECSSVAQMVRLPGARNK